MKKLMICAAICLASLNTFAHSSMCTIICKSEEAVQLQLTVHFEEEEGVTAISNVLATDQTGKLRTVSAAEVALYDYDQPFKNLVIKSKRGAILAVIAGETIVDAYGTRAIKCEWDR